MKSISNYFLFMFIIFLGLYLSFSGQMVGIILGGIALGLGLVCVILVLRKTTTRPVYYNIHYNAEIREVTKNGLVRTLSLEELNSLGIGRVSSMSLDMYIKKESLFLLKKRMLELVKTDQWRKIKSMGVLPNGK